VLTPTRTNNGGWPLLAQLVGVTREVFLHQVGSMQSSLRMILMGNRSAEQCENAVAGGLNDVAIVAMRRIHHELKRWIHDRTRFFGVEALHQVHRALDVGEQCRHRLALAIKCR